MIVYLPAGISTQFIPTIYNHNFRLRTVLNSSAMYLGVNHESKNERHVTLKCGGYTIETLEYTFAPLEDA
jgi:hypothetical protein